MIRELLSSRSDHYQYLLKETSVSTEFLQTFTNDHSLYSEVESDAIFLIREQLKVEFWNLVEEICTPLQKKVLTGYADGYTQHEMAKMFKMTQGSINKCLNGNVDYKISKKSYGGVKKKLRKAINLRPIFQELFNKITELSEK